MGRLTETQAWTIREVRALIEEDLAGVNVVPPKPCVEMLELAGLYWRVTPSRDGKSSAKGCYQYRTQPKAGIWQELGRSRGVRPE